MFVNRQGEPGANATKGPLALANAVADFKKKFTDKTRNKWEDRDNFQFAPGKYTLLDMGDDADDDVPVPQKVGPLSVFDTS
jgi:poly [ADP-ribose] polymerase